MTTAPNAAASGLIGVKSTRLLSVRSPGRQPVRLPLHSIRISPVILNNSPTTVKAKHLITTVAMVINLTGRSLSLRNCSINRQIEQ